MSSFGDKFSLFADKITGKDVKKEALTDMDI
jgi:hypothetical protein